MRLLGFAALLLALLWGPPALAQDPNRILEVRVSHIIVPQTRSWRLTSAAQPIRIEGVKAHVQILEQAATTTLDIALRNPSPRLAEAVLLLPVPDGAAVHGFDFQGQAAEPTAQLMRKEEARRLYRSIVARTRDPALLEFAGMGLVRSSVFPVPPNGTQRVRLSYNHLLQADQNRIDYILPRSEALEVNIPWEVVVDIKAKTPVATVYSPSHELALKRHAPRHLTLRVKEEGRMQPGAFRLSYLLERNGLSASLFAYPDPKIGGGYFLLLAGLPRQSADERRHVRREVTLVIDRSGSMAGGAMDQVRAAAQQVIEGLQDGETFNIIDYSNSVELFAAKPVLRTGESVARARAYLQALRPMGGTNIHDALVEALRQEPAPGMLPIVLFLTDGLPTIGRTSEVEIRSLVEKGNPLRRRIFTFGVGHDVNVPLLDRIAELSRAAPTYVLPEEDVEVKVAQVFRRLYGPVLADGRIETLDPEGRVTTQAVRELIPAALPDLFEGDQLVLLGQYRGSQPLTFRLNGSYLGKPRTFQFQFDLGSATTRNAFVPRLWASRRIAYLVDQIRQAGALSGTRPAVVGESVLDDPRLRELVQEILRLSTEFGILSEYTAFLATEGTGLTDWQKLN
ncbi:MAG: VIT domain-containing protein, partial [Planctomycetota bacterium]